MKILAPPKPFAKFSLSSYKSIISGAVNNLILVCKLGVKGLEKAWLISIYLLPPLQTKDSPVPLSLDYLSNFTCFILHW